MQTGAKLLTAPTPLANYPRYEPEKLQSSAISLVSSSFLFWRTERSLTQEEEHMDQPQPRAKSRNRDEIWFSISRSARQEQEEIRGHDQTPFQTMSSRPRPDRSVSPATIPAISTPAAINKPLPPCPESDKKKRKPISLRSLVRRRPSSNSEESDPDPNHLQPEPHQRQRSSSTNATLSPDPSQNYRQNQSSRSVPSSPSHPPQAMARAHSATANYSDPSYYEPYSPQPQQRSHRAHSTEADFEAQPPRARRTFPDTPSQSNAPHQRQRPHTWLSPSDGNEPFHDASEFHLFVEATSGLPDGSMGFSTFSPSSPPHLQGSLFPRGRQNDRIPIPLQQSHSARPASQSYDVSSWQTTGYDYMPRQSNAPPLFSSSALPSPAPSQRSRTSPHMNAVNLELERLGLSDDEERNDDELPDYAQSQAEMSEKRRKEAASRARELEARWNRSRGR